MKFYQRALSTVLATSMGLSMLGGVPQAFAADVPDAPAALTLGSIDSAGDITGTIRFGYPVHEKLLQERNLKIEVSGGARKTLKLAELPEKNIRKDKNGMVQFVDFGFIGLPAAQGGTKYQVTFSGDGFKTFQQNVKLNKYSQHIVVGTDDATFTQGNVNGDGKVDAADLEAVKAKLGTTEKAYDLDGNGKVDISDLAIVQHNIGVEGQSQVQNSSLIAANALPMDYIVDSLNQQNENSNVTITGEVASLFQNDGKEVKLQPKSGTHLQLTIPLVDEENNDTEPIEMTQVEIVSPLTNPLDKGTLVVETVENGQPKMLEIPFDESVPDGVFAIQRQDDRRKVVTIDLGNRVPVKKITIKVDVDAEGKEVVVQQIKFLEDVIPAEPSAASQKIKNVRPTAGSEQVTLTWDVFPNVTGYKVYYGTSATELTQVQTTDTTSITIGGLENLKTYHFAVAPVNREWEGSKSEVVSATPKPSSAPAKVDNVVVEEQQNALLLRWKKAKDATKYVVQYREQGQQAFQDVSASNITGIQFYLSGLNNDKTYEVRVAAVNDIGQGPWSEIAAGKPHVEKIEGPTLPTANRVDNSEIQSATYPTYNTSGLRPDFRIEQVYDGNFATSWIARTWSESREFTFTLKTPVDMNYLIYVPDLGREPNERNRRYRDFFESFVVKVASTADGELKPVPNVSFERAKDNAYFVIKFPKQQNVQKISIEAGQWAGAGNISLSEIAFYKYDGLEEEINNLFANGSHTELQSGVNKDKIDALRARANQADAYYVNKDVLLDELKNAEQLLAGEQNKLVVRQGFQSRSTGEDNQHGQTASDLQPLGINAWSDHFITIYADIPAGEKVELVHAQYHAETNETPKTYSLQNGRNHIWLDKIGSSPYWRGGSMYLRYSGENASDIKLQIRNVGEGQSFGEIPYLDIAPDQWYGKSEQERKALLTPYVKELNTYKDTIENPDKNNAGNATEIGTPSVLLSLPATQVLAGLGNGGEEAQVQNLYDAIVAWEELMFLTNKTQGIIDADAKFSEYRYPMQTRQNIRYAKMFAGAFMFAAGSYIGIEWDEVPGMVSSKPLEKNGELFGWGIAHEVGHNMDKLGKAEITNNIYSMVAQAADESGAMQGETRLEKEGRYADIFNKVAQGKPGAASDVFVQLGMYWQLHLAYDEGGNVMEGSGPLNFYNEFFKKWKAGEYKEEKSYDDRVALIASEVVNKDLSEFFTRWGMQLKEETLDILDGKLPEERAIWYLNDDSRRDRLAGEKEADFGTITMDAQAERDIVTLTFNVEQNAEQLQGYEIRRDNKPIAFVMGNEHTYKDKIGSANNQTFTYTVRAVDRQGYMSELSKEKQIRVSYDATISADKYIIERQSDNSILITAKDGEKLTTGGLKITDSNLGEGAYEVQIQKGEPIVSESVDRIPWTDLVPAKPVEEVPMEELVPAQPVEEIPMEELVPAQPIVPEQPEVEPEPPTEKPEEPDAGVPEEGTPEGTTPEQPDGDGTDAGQEEDTTESETTPEEDTKPADEEEAENQDDTLVEIEDPATPLSALPEEIQEDVEDKPSVTTETGKWIKAKDSNFGKSEAEGYFLTYFNKPGTTSEDTRIWMYDATQILITGVPENVDLNNIELLSYPGDNVAFMEGASIGVLGHDYGEIKKGTVIVTGTYRGDPSYNTILGVGKFQQIEPASDGTAQVTTSTLDGKTYLLAELPEDKEVSTISDGIFIFVPANQDMFKRVNEDHVASGEKPSIGNKILTELKVEMWRSDVPEGERKQMTSDTLYITVPHADDLPEIRFQTGAQGGEASE